MSGHGGIRGALQLPDGLVLSWGFDGIINLWELDAVRPVARIASSSEAVTAVRVIDDRRFLSWSGDLTVRLWQLDDLTARRALPLALTYDGSRSPVPPFLVDGTRGLVAWDYDQIHYIRFTDAAAPHGVTAFPSERSDGDNDGDDDSGDDHDDGDIVATTRLPGGNLITFSHAGGVREWSLPDLTLVLEYEGLPAGARGACTLADGRFAAWYAGRVAVYRPGRADVAELLDPPRDGIIHATPLRGGGFAYRTVAHRLVIWNDGEQRSLAVPHWREPLHTAVAPNDDLVLWSPYADGLLATHDTGQALFSTDGSSINHVALHPAWPDTRRVLASVASGEIFHFDLAAAPAQDRQAGAALSSAVHGLHRASSDELLACHQDGELSLHAMATGARTRSMRIRERTAGALPAPGNRLITWEATGSIHVWSLETTAVLGVLAERDHGPFGPTVVLDPQRAVSWSSLRDRVGFLLWSLERVKPIAVLGRDDKAPALGAASLDAGELVTWSELPVLRRWDAAGCLLETIACHDEAITGGIPTSAGVVTWADRAEVSVWSPGRRPRRTSLRGTSGAIVTARANADEVLFCVDDGALVVWRPASPREQWKLEHTVAGRATEVFALRGGRWIVLDDRGGFSLCSKAGVQHRPGSPARAQRAVVTDDDHWLVVANGRELLVLSIAQALQPAATLSLPSAILALHPASNGRVALGLGDGRVVVAAP
jgi:WD40 repeat protein